MLAIVMLGVCELFLLLAGSPNDVDVSMSESDETGWPELVLFAPVFPGGEKELKDVLL